MFSFKDRTPDPLKSLEIYQFTCAGCNSRYIGETSRPFSTSLIKEHTMIKTHIFLSTFLNLFLAKVYTDFLILDTANNPIGLELKEALYTNKNKPNVNKQVHILYI